MSSAVGASAEEAAMATGERRASANAIFPPGYHFNPHDDELVLYYLRNKIANLPLPYEVFNDVNLYEHHPAELVEKYKSYGECRWYFFTPRERKYPNGSRPNRKTINGYWKATGVEKQILFHTGPIGVRKALVFYMGKAGNGKKTDWIMHEYINHDPTELPLKPNGTMKLNDWVLCTIQKKRGADGGECNRPSSRVQRAMVSPSNVLSEPHQLQQDAEGPMPLSFRVLDDHASPGAMIDSNALVRSCQLPQGNEGLHPNYEIYNNNGLFQPGANRNKGDMINAYSYCANDQNFEDSFFDSSSESGSAPFQSDLIRSNMPFVPEGLPMTGPGPVYPSSMMMQDFNVQPPVNECVYNEYLRTDGLGSWMLPGNSIAYEDDYFAGELPTSVMPSTNYPLQCYPLSESDAGWLEPENRIDYKDDNLLGQFPATVMPSTNYPLQDYLLNGSDFSHIVKDTCEEDDKLLGDTLEGSPKDAAA